MNGISCTNPKGAFYAFPKIEHNKYGSDKEFVTELLKDNWYSYSSWFWIWNPVWYWSL